MILTPPCLPRQCAWKHVCDDFERSVKSSSQSGQDHVVTYASQVACESIRLNETMRPFPSLYLFPVASYRHTTVSDTGCDLR